jgi:flagellar protein FlbT
MALKLTLKPHEKLILGTAVVTNGDSKANLIIENQIPILREKDILSVDAADTPCKRIYLVVQLMYIDEKNLTDHHATYWQLVRDVVKAAPSTLRLIEAISKQILAGRYYQALKQAKKLIAHEEKVISHVRTKS